jgi:pimeloyl-ACP methyl ester carboxylesterase
MTGRRPDVIAAIALVALSACSTRTPVGVNHINPERAERQLHVNALSAGRPSAETLQVLLRLGLYESYQEDPAPTLAELHQRLAQRGEESLLLPLAELSYLHAAEEEDQRFFLAAAAYAYAYAFPEKGPRSENPAETSLRLALDLYNRGIARAFGADARKPVELPASGTYELPFGTLELEVPEQGFYWASRKIDRVTSGVDYDVRGLRNRYRTPGVGAALSATVALPDIESTGYVATVAPRLKVAVSEIVRIEDPVKSLATGQLRGKLEVYTRDNDETVAIAGREVPIEYESTSALAYTLEGAAIYSLELAAFFSAMTRDESDTGTVRTTGLIMLKPYRRGTIPLVLVHGTASSSARWAELVNELENDPRIWEHFQIWLFNYNTGNPIAYSGGILRQALLETVATLDPKATDPALRQMVVMGHSQGGLLTKLTAIDSGDAFWKNVSSVPLDQLRADEETRGLLRRSLFFTPLPFVKRVIFVATPHRGSYLASFSIVGLIRDFITLPGDLAGRLTNLATVNQGKTALSQLGGKLPTSLDNMTPGNRFIKTLAAIPVKPPIHVHSICAVKGDGPPDGQSDGVVRYESAHIEPVDSELVVRSGHSTQDVPATIEEIRRILLLHLAQAPLPAKASKK